LPDGYYTNNPAPGDDYSYSKTLLASGGTLPYTWYFENLSEEDVDPLAEYGLSLNALTGVISGTPIKDTGSSSISLTIVVSDDNGFEDVKTFTLKISIVDVLFNISGLSVDANGIPYLENVYENEVIQSPVINIYRWKTPYTLTLSSDQIPDGTYYEYNDIKSMIKIKGTPKRRVNHATLPDDPIFTATQPHIDYVVQCSMTTTSTKTQSYHLKLLPEHMSFVNMTPSSGTFNTAYNYTFTNKGGIAPYTYAIASGALPTGLTLNSSTGVLSGTPISYGAHSFTVKITDAIGSIYTSSTVNFTINVPTLSIITSSIPSGTIGMAYSVTFSATGGIPTYVWSSSTLPSGVSLNSTTGVLSGTPTESGNFTVSITVGDVRGLTYNVSRQFVLTIVDSDLRIVTTSLMDAYSNEAYEDTLTAVEGTTPYTWSLQDGSTLPPGLSLNSSTGVISGITNNENEIVYPYPSGEFIAYDVFCNNIAYTWVHNISGLYGMYVRATNTWVVQRLDNGGIYGNIYRNPNTGDTIFTIAYQKTIDSAKVIIYEKYQILGEDAGTYCDIYLIKD
jgi:hypothetical protein